MKNSVKLTIGSVFLVAVLAVPPVIDKLSEIDERGYRDCDTMVVLEPKTMKPLVSARMEKGYLNYWDLWRLESAFNKIPVSEPVRNFDKEQLQRRLRGELDSR